MNSAVKEASTAEQPYRRLRRLFAVQWIGVGIIIGFLIYFWSPASLMLLCLIALTVPFGIRGQRRTLKKLRHRGQSPSLS
jgi:uncharacterized membrane protein YdbT with pleckstrin-like domain